MKKVLLFAATAAALLSSCNKQFVEEVDPMKGSGSIGFETYLSNNTKGVAKTDFAMGDKFVVLGGVTGVDVLFDLKTPNITRWAFDAFPNKAATVVNYGGVPTVWRYDSPVSWGDESITFFAFSPAASTESGVKFTAPANLEIPAIDFTVIGGYDIAKDIVDAEAVASRGLTKTQVDLLSAFAANQKKAQPTVPLQFKHALTRLSFAVKSNAPAGHMIRINSIALKNVAVDGKLTLAYDETKAGEESYLGGWSVDAAAVRKNFAVNLLNDVSSLIKDNDIHTVTDADEALMMIPQSLVGVELEVRYAYSADGTNWENYTSGSLVKIDLSKVSTHWNPNKQIRYILNITQGENIGFSAEVLPWGDESDVEFLTKTVNTDAQEVGKFTLTAGDKIKVTNDFDWITYQKGTDAAEVLTNTGVVAEGAVYTFAVTNNITDAARENEIVIDHKDGSRTVLRVSQQKGTGIVKVAKEAGDVLTLKLKKDDVVAVPQTKAAASWVLGNTAAIAADYTAMKDESYTISVEANAGEARAATVIVTMAGVAHTYTIEQAGAITKVSVAAAGKKILDGVVDDVVTLTTGGGAWLTINEGSAVELKGAVTAAKAYTIDVAPNTTATARTATFTVKTGSATTTYEVTQDAPTAVAIVAAGGVAHSGAAVDNVNLTKGGGAWLTINEGTAVELIKGSTITAKAYTIDVAANTTATARTATFTITTAAGVATTYELTQEAAAPVAPTAIPVVAAGGKAHNGAVAEVIALTAGGGDWLTITDNGAAAIQLPASHTAVGDYTIDVTENKTASERKATFTVTIAGVTTTYELTQAAATPAAPTALTAKAAGDQVHTGAINDAIALTVGGGTWLKITDNGGTAIQLPASHTAAGSYTIDADMNTTNATRTATFTVTVAGVTTTYELTQTAASEVTIAEIGLDGTGSTETVALVEGDVIKAGTDVSWLILTSADGSAITYTGAADVTVTDVTASAWTVSATDNTTDQADRSGSFVVVKADGNVVVYTASQAKA